MPPAMMTIIGLAFPIHEAANAAANSSQLFQSGKFSGVMRSRAEAPIRPVTAGFNPPIMPSNIVLLLNLPYILQIASTIRKDGRPGENGRLMRR